MDRSEFARDLEFAVNPPTARTVPTVRPGAMKDAGGEALPAHQPPSKADTGFYPPSGWDDAARISDPAARRREAIIKAGEFARKAGRWIALVAAAWAALVFVLVIAYRFIDPPWSSLMVQKRITGNSYEQIWVPIEAVSANAVRSVIASEDGRFCEHWGVDYDAMQIAIEGVGRGRLRGASTISMQVAKNLFLWPSKSYLRKALELPLAYLIEIFWSKRRIMEVYLNIAEWGPGIFGIEAAARHHFSKPALRLSSREGALLAAALPNPIRRTAGQPGLLTRRMATRVQVRSASTPKSAFSCVK